MIIHRLNTARFTFGLLVVLLLTSQQSALGQFQELSEAETRPAEDSSSSSAYFDELIEEMEKRWPQNRTLRFVFHGHSVPAGYFKTPVVRRFDSYPTLFHQRLCEAYPHAVIDVCVTAIGGENSERGAKRFEEDVLALKPDVVFIDYSLNDRRIGLGRASEAWESMIKACRETNTRLVLMTPTPDNREKIEDPDSPLMDHAGQVLELAKKYGVPVVDSYGKFRQLVLAGQSVDDFLSQSNHPNRKGHQVVAEQLFSLFQTQK